jgi:hypothetical protein
MAKELYLKLVAWRKSVGAQMPARNALFNPDSPTGILRNGKLREAAPLRE